MPGRDLFVIVDRDHVAEWQRRALATLDERDRLTLLVCTNTAIPKRVLRHPFYYALNLMSVRNALTRPVLLTGITAPIVARHDFAAGKDGAWQTLPAEIITLISEAKPDAVIKLGMTLMRVPADIETPILSWHHGDPDLYRGRPAGFYEMLHGRSTMGQIVQIIGNRLDAGTVVAFAETRVIPHSWRATLIEAFRHSPLLLNEALRNIAAGRAIPRHSNGPNYRLPGNIQVARASLEMAVHKLRRVTYGAFVEKKWVVSTARVTDAAEAGAIASGAAPFPAETTWQDAPRNADHIFQADPFFVAGSTDLLVEALNAATGKGEIVRIDARGPQRVSSEPGHFSYPAPVSDSGINYIVPEIAGWSEPRAYVLDGDSLREAGRLDIAGSPRISDPTFHWHDGRLWLFGNIAAAGSNALYLWHAPSLFARFEPHPLNPIRLSPRGARMGGAILAGGDHPVRLGQSFVDGYGDGLFAFAIHTMTPNAYDEVEIGSLRFSGRSGPHTFNVSADGNEIVFDWYRDRFSPMAGMRRLRNRRR